MMTPRVAIFSLAEDEDGTAISKANIVARQIEVKIAGNTYKRYVSSAAEENLKKITTLMIQQNQKSVVLLDDRKKAFLMSVYTNRRDEMGHFLSVPKEVAENLESYVHDKDLGYFIIYPSN